MELGLKAPAPLLTCSMLISLSRPPLPYQVEYEDGFITNRILKKPIATSESLIYSLIDQESKIFDASNFLPTWDSTDHFHFVCQKCKSVADVLEGKFSRSYGGGVNYALFFRLGCRRCGATGQRKIYLDNLPDACKFQKTFHDCVLYLYGDDENPAELMRYDVGESTSAKGSQGR